MEAPRLDIRLVLENPSATDRSTARPPHTRVERLIQPARGIEPRLKLFRGDPPLRMVRGTDLVDLVAVQEALLDLKPGYEALAAVA